MGAVVLGQVRLPDFNNVAAGQTATLQVPRGNTFYGILCRCTTALGAPVAAATIATEVTRVRIKLNSALVWDVTATQIQYLQLLYGASSNVTNLAGVLPLHFSRPWVENPVFEALLAWGTGDVQNFTIEITLAAGATIAQITPTAIVDTTTRPLGMYRSLLTYPRNVTGTGVYEEQNLPKFGNSKSAGYAAVHVPRIGATDISELTVYVNGYSLLDRVPYYIQNEILQWRDRTAQTAYFPVAFDLIELPSGYQPVYGLNDLRINPNYTVAPNSLEWLAEVYQDIPEQIYK